MCLRGYSDFENDGAESYVIIAALSSLEDLESGAKASKLGAEIVNVLFPNHIAEMRKSRPAYWPAEWEAREAEAEAERERTKQARGTAPASDSDDSESEDGEEDDDLFRNPNRGCRAEDSSSEEESDDDAE